MDTAEGKVSETVPGRICVEFLAITVQCAGRNVRDGEKYKYIEGRETV